MRDLLLLKSERPRNISVRNALVLRMRPEQQLRRRENLIIRFRAAVRHKNKGIKA